MNKLKLDLDALDVESFDVTRGEKERGTVAGQEYTELFCATNENTCVTCPPASETNYTGCGSCGQPNTVCAYTCQPNLVTCGPDCA